MWSAFQPIRLPFPRHQAYAHEADDCEIKDVEEIAGRGVCANVNGKRVCVGNSKMMEDEGAKWHPCHEIGTIIHVSIDGVYAGHIVISDLVKSDSKAAIEMLKAEGVKKKRLY